MISSLHLGYELETGGHYHFTCVENKATDRVLYFDWFIPGPQGTIAPGQSRTEKRFFTTREPVDINGCAVFRRASKG
jgi:hypothetical protein